MSAMENIGKKSKEGITILNISQEAFAKRVLSFESFHKNIKYIMDEVGRAIMEAESLGDKRIKALAPVIRPPARINLTIQFILPIYRLSEKFRLCLSAQLKQV